MIEKGFQITVVGDVFTATGARKGELFEFDNPILPVIWLEEKYALEKIISLARWMIILFEVSKVTEYWEKGDS